MYKDKDLINMVFQDNCIEVMSNIPDNKVDLVLTDPPNLILAKHFSTRAYFRRSFGDLGVVDLFYKEFFKEMERILKDTGFFYIFCNETSYPIFWFYSYSFTKKIRCITWDKISAFNGYHWRHQTEQILFGLMPKCPKVKTGDGDIIKCRAVPKDIRKHPAEKPLELIEKLLLKHSNPGDVILEPFSGSGVVPMACKKNGRNYIAVELDEGYYELTLENINSVDFKENERKVMF